MLDAVVIGAGPNGLAGAIELAQNGMSVLVLEAKDRPGGAVYSLETTRPGFLHDVGAAFFPFGEASPAFRSFNLGNEGLQWCFGDYDSAHPAPDGTCAAISRNLELSLKTFGPDADAWSGFHHWQQSMERRLVDALTAPLPGLGGAWNLGITNLWKLGMAGMFSGATYSRRHFQTEAAQRIIPGLALHVDLGPTDFTSGALGLVLALLASSEGFRVPKGGAKAITQALVNKLQSLGGNLQLNTHVDEILIRDKQAAAVRTNHGDEIPFAKAVLADVGAPALFQKLIAPKHASYWVKSSIKRFRHGWGTFKMDWALSSPVPWKSEVARRSAVVHAGDSIADLIAFTREVRLGRLPSNPYLVIGQQSLFDPTRAPEKSHTLWAYSHVPSHLPEGWQQHRESFADRIEERIEGLAPGFGDLILDRAIHTPVDLEAMDENLVDGDLGGGSAQLSHQLFFRPIFPYFRYRTHIKKVYLASASSHPGAGVHGACGLNAARMALLDSQ